jgi:hypothetical protein
VRNNLFHGNKASESESDLAIVSAAYSTLFHFVSEMGLPEKTGCRVRIIVAGLVTVCEKVPFDP